MLRYCIPIHVPIYVDGGRHLVVSEWGRALALLRDSLIDRFDEFILVAPHRPAEDAKKIGMLEPISNHDGFDVRPSISADLSKQAYWLGGGRKRWHEDVNRALDVTDFAHTVVDNLYRPIAFDAERITRRRRVPRAYFVDTDIIAQEEQLIEAGLMQRSLSRRLHGFVYERTQRRIVAAADVSFLKGQRLCSRYGIYARNYKLFHDTSYHSSEVATDEMVERRLGNRKEGLLRLVYCGRLVARKGCDHSVQIVAKAREAGVDVTLDLIGDGPERAALETQVQKLGQGDAIRFLGSRVYGADLLQDLAGYDGLLFTPIAEDTPRMIFDGYAVGLPLLAYDIPYVKERADGEGAALLLPKGNTDDAVRNLIALSRDPDRLVALSRAALVAGKNNATDLWYKRRADWTFEAWDRARFAEQ